MRPGGVPHLRNRVTPEKKEFAKRLRVNLTRAEKVVWERVRRRQLGHRFRRQVVILGWIADFYCAQFQLVVEVDGAAHQGREKEDARRDAVMQEKGISVLRLRNEEVLENPDAAVAKILAAMHAAKNAVFPPYKPPYANYESSKPEEGVCGVSKGSRGTRVLPDDESLTAFRFEIAAKAGLSPAEARDQWARMADHEFPRPYRDWNRVWRRWCRNAVEWGHAGPRRAVKPLPTQVPSVDRTREVLARITGGMPVLKSIAVLLLMLVASTAHADVSVSWFAFTPRCCNAAAIHTDVLTNDRSRYIAGRFEYYRLKADGTCQHVKHVYGPVYLQGYTRVTRADGMRYFNQTLFEGPRACCYGYVGWNRYCLAYDYPGNTYWWEGLDPML